DKNGILEFAQALQNLGVEILSTGGTYAYLLDNGITVTEVASVTNFPEILDGRVKTLHPNIHGGILAKRDDEEHLQEMEQHEIIGIDLVCVNLYPFEATITNPNCSFDQAMENIDIGGPAMIRASSKNHAHVVIVTNPKDYSAVVNEIRLQGDVSAKTRLVLAQQAFSHTAYYDSLISNYLNQQLTDPSNFNAELTIPAKLVQNLRYGENAHQVAAFYKDSGNIDGLLASFRQLQGKELSYNNLADADTAWECVKQFQDPACVIVKHANPCGVAIATDAISSYIKAFAADPISSFGGIIAFNSVVDLATAAEVSKQFLEVLIAPNYTAEALAILAKKPNVRILQINLTIQHNHFEYKRIGGGLLVQSPENKLLDPATLKTVTKLQPDAVMLQDLKFAWQVARFVKSNAIVLVKNQQTIGIGAGQMSRIDSSKIALTKAREFGFDAVGAVCASDAFFPFRDNVDLLAAGGVKAIIQPGGSIKDDEVFFAANELNLAMVLTGYRTFRH
ncbi:MAG: bifunctional phosphoribosylaminoimidazolecarboxamide formyltransferase/IMP cyclohydrolase, partial [Burkholderiales bacterium]